MRKRVLNAVIDNIACGLDPEQCRIFVQSDVPQHSELTWILNTVTPMGDLNRMTQFKEKSKQNEQNINAGLFSYPVLMAADILLYRTSVVPVGEDQIQHLELAREIARDFANRFEPFFPEPEPYLTKAKRIMGLDGKSKMSKSLNNHIPLSVDEESLRKLIMPAMTDENRKRRSDPGNPDICNVFAYHTFFSSEETQEEVRKGCQSAGMGCVDCKKMLVPNIMKLLGPFQEKRNELVKNLDFIEDVLDTGAKRCSAIAGETMEKVKDICGLNWKKEIK